jgi:hypothetical protein
MRKLLLQTILFPISGILAHICLLYPPQRGALNVSTPGDPSCYRRTPFCGTIPLSPPTTTFITGELVTLSLQQNLNHFYPQRPGFIDVAIAAAVPDPQDNDWVTLSVVRDAPAFDMVFQTTMSLTVSLPLQPSAHSILRVRYVSYNPLEIDPANNTDAIFYNCADIAIIESAEKVERNKGKGIEKALSPLLSYSASSDYSCVTPPSWTANYTETNPFGFVSHTIWWDSILKKTRWDRIGALDSSGQSKSLSLINDYSKTPMPVEWVNFISSGACYAYGNDAFYPFAFGDSNNMTYMGRSESGSDFWEIESSFAKWVTQDLGLGLCKLISWSIGDASVSLSGSFIDGPIDIQVFTPAASCNTLHPIWAGCRKHHQV